MSMNAAPEWEFSSTAGQVNYGRALETYPGQVIVDLAAIKSNMEQLRATVEEAGSNAQLMGIVKADAYGHGLLPTALAALAGGATWLGSAQPREAILLRQAGIGPDRCRILVWMYNSATAPLKELIAQDIDISVGSLTGISHVLQAAHELGQKARVHVEVETGFGRNGFTADCFDEVITLLKDGVKNELLDVVGLWSHLAVADMPHVSEFVNSTEDQIASFETFSSRMSEAGLRPRVRHLANTAATLLRPETHYDLTRPGIGLYGYAPDPSMGTASNYNLKPAMTLQAQLGTIKNLPVGHGISYGRTYVTEKPTSTAILPLGYADGIHRSASGFDKAGFMGTDRLGGPVRIMSNQGAKIVHVSGRVCMDQCVLDLQGLADNLGVSEGDTVVLFGPGRGEEYLEPTADDWAKRAQTISYEIFACLRNRIPRLYLHAPDVLLEKDLQLLDPSTIL